MIAISYRRQDSTGITGRIYDRLQSEFGKPNVFMDFDSIPYGVDFREHITRTLDQAKVVLVIIGPDWAGQRSRRLRRIDDPSDVVRLEVACALKQNKPIIPVLVNNAKMPTAESLPQEIAPLAFRNGLILDSGIDFHHHTDRLIAGIRTAAGDSSSGKPREQRKGISGDRPRQRIYLIAGGALVLAALCVAAVIFGLHRNTKIAPSGKAQLPLGASSSIADLPGTLLVTTEPSQATVTVENQVQTSPATFTGLRNEVQLKVQLHGYETVNTKIPISDKGATRFGPIVLTRRQPVSLQVNGDSRGQMLEFVDADGEHYRLIAPGKLMDIPSGYGQMIVPGGQTESVWIKSKGVTSWTYHQVAQSPAVTPARAVARPNPGKLFAGTWGGDVDKVIKNAAGTVIKSWKERVEVVIDESETRWDGLTGGSVLKRDRTLSYNGFLSGSGGSKQQLHATLIIRDDGVTATYTRSEKPGPAGVGQLFEKGSLQKIQ